ncbi:MAG TPA: ATP-binding cassette domain-containing protein, partial [Candidatus Berkiella sp.]|nr:ATP-binding cassette domain-containing protein [Candidatus Berkiella sp.]
MISLNELSLHYGDKLLFDDVNLLLTSGKRYAIVGANGTGKSSLLRLIMGQETPSLGEILMPKGVTIGWVKQDHFRYEDQRVLDVVIQGKKALWQAMEEKEALLSGEWTDSAVNKLHYLEE